MLADDRSLQLAENVTPLVRAEVVARGGDELVAAADAVSARLTTEGLLALNAAVRAGRPEAQVAAGWLQVQGWRDGPRGDPQPPRPAGRRSGRHGGGGGTGRKPRRFRRRRRPTGAAPPLPRSLGRTGKFWATALTILVAASWCWWCPLRFAGRRPGRPASCRPSPRCAPAG